MYNLYYICEAFRSATFALRELVPLVSNFSLMSYGITLWGNSTESNRMFVLQKRALRTILGTKHGQTCRGLLEEYLLTHEKLSSFKRRSC